MNNSEKEAVNSDIVQQRRSRFRLRLTALIGALITVSSSGVLFWLLGLGPFSSTSDRSTVKFRVLADCSEPISASIHTDASEDRIWFALIHPDLPSRVDGAKKNSLKRSFFSKCGVNVEFLDEIESVVIPGNISGDSWSPDTLPPRNQALNIKVDPKVSLYSFELMPGQNPNFAGEILITPAELFVRDSFGRFHMGIEGIVRNTSGMVELAMTVSLPEKSMQADIIRPQPISIGNTPVETYRFLATASPDTEMRWIDVTNFIGFIDPEKIHIREALLIMASTLLGAGISALLEAFLAGGTAALVGRSAQEKLPEVNEHMAATDFEDSATQSGRGDLKQDQGDTSTGA